MFAHLSLGTPTGSRRLLVAIATLLVMPLAAEAKTLYVNAATGNDATTYAANSEATPWRSIGRAAAGSTDRLSSNANEAARAGDVVLISGGTYVTIGNLTGGGFGRQDVAYNPVNNGAAGNPIRFECTATCQLTFSSGAGPMIGSMDRNYIEWSGFTINEATAPSRGDTGPVTFFRAVGGSIENSTLIGNPNWTERVGDNYTGVRLEDAMGVRIAGNRIRDFGGQTGDRNHAGIETYRSAPLLIENNEIVNCGSGIYLKAYANVVQTGRVRYNAILNNRYGINVLLQPFTSAQPMLIYQNIFTGNREAGLWINAFNNGDTDAKWIRFFNNTLVNNASAVATYNWAAFPAGANLLFWNNIMAGTGNRVRQDNTDAVGSNQKDRHDFDRNLYETATIEVGGAARTMAYWQGLGQDTSAVVAGPGFVNASDYHLTPGSPARTVGRALYGIGGGSGTVVPAGAYITGNEMIGAAGGAPSSQLPSAPTGLRIIGSGQ